MLSPYELGVWEDGYIAGRRDNIAVIIAAFVELGHTKISLKELQEIAQDFELELPDHYIGERVQELLSEHHEDRADRSEA